MSDDADDAGVERCPACEQPYAEKIKVEAENGVEAFEKADSSRNPCISSPKGTVEAFVYYHE